MKTVFADSFYFFALLNPRDEAHEPASRFARQWKGETVSTAWVFTELGDGLAAPRSRAGFTLLLDRFAADPLCRLLPPSPSLFDAGIELFRTRPDKAWSLTDCISFAAMRQQDIRDALTGDHHFTQAGFNALLL